jgi:hypothetical protein
MNQTSRFFLFIRVLLGFTLPQAEAQPKPALRLAGAWQSDNKLNTVTFRPDGTGKNADGSRFRWRLEKTALVFRTISPEGKVGPESRIPIEFTRDEKEYALLFEGGKLRSVFHRLTTAGQRYANRTKRGREYLGRKNSAKSDDDDVQTIPSRTKPKIGSDTNSESNEPRSSLYQVGRNVLVSKAYAAIEHSEVVIAADPGNANRLLAASMFSPPPVDQAAPKVVVYASEDGGKTWVLSFERKDKNPRSFADPAFALPKDGAA